jgi:hypothetical protein
MKEFLLYLVLLITISSEEVFAKPPKKPFVGFSSFAAMNKKYPCSNFINISKSYSKPAMSVLLSTFGTNTDCIKRFLSAHADKPHLLQVHLTNETCRRAKGRCTQDEIKPTWGADKYNKELERGNRELKTAIQNRVRFVERNIIPLTNSKTTLMLTTGLEDNFSDKAYLNVQLWIKQAGYRGYLVRNPLADFCSRTRGAHLCELHSVFSYWAGVPCVFNIDGNNLSPREQLEQLRKFRFCHALFFWEPVSQGREFGQPFTPPKSRSFNLPTGTVNEYKKTLNQYERLISSR